MSKLEWDQPQKRHYHTGVSNVVLFVQNRYGEYEKGVAWNGFTGIDDNASGGEVNAIWADNMKYAVIQSAEDLEGKLDVLQYPIEFAQCNGEYQPVPGLFFTSQPRRAFALVYRTEIGTDTDKEAGHMLHFLYGARVKPSTAERSTINDNPDAAKFSFDFYTVPIKIPGYKPSSKVQVNSLRCSLGQMNAIENIIYGTDHSEPRLPFPEELFEIVNEVFLLNASLLDSTAYLG